MNRPDYLHFDLDPVQGADFDDVLKTAMLVHEALDALEAAEFRQDHRLARHPRLRPDRARPVQKEVWTFAKQLAQSIESMYPDSITAEYRIAKRPKGRVLVDYNQNAWGRTLSSVYSVRPKPHAPVSTPVTWEEVESGFRIEDFRIDNVPARVSQESAIFGSRSTKPAAASNWKRSYDFLPLKPPFRRWKRSAVDKIPEGDGWQYEPKWDGFRCLVFRDGDEVAIAMQSRPAAGPLFPRNRRSRKDLPAKQFVLDGELAR